MKKVLIKRVKRPQKPIGAKAKLLAGLGVGATLAGFSGASSKAGQNLKPIVRTQEKGKNQNKEKITKSLKDIFGVKEAKAGWYDDWDTGNISVPGPNGYGSSYGLPAGYESNSGGSASAYTAQVLSQDTNSANSALLESLQTNTAGQAIIQGEEAKYDQMVANSTQPTSPGTGSGEAETEESGLPGGTEESGTEGSGESGGIPVISDTPSVIADSMQQVNNIPPPAEPDLINSLPSSQNSSNLQYLNPLTGLVDVGSTVGGSPVYYNNVTGQFQDITGQYIYSGNYDEQGNFVFSENSSLSVNPPAAFGQNMTWEQIVAENGAPAGSTTINIGGTLYSKGQWESGLVPGQQGPVLATATQTPTVVNNPLATNLPVAYGQNMTWEQIVAENGAPAGSTTINIGGTLYSQAQWESGLVPGEQGPVLPVTSNLGNIQNAFEIPNIPQPEPYIPNVQLPSNYQQVVTPYLTQTPAVQNYQNVDISAPVDFTSSHQGVDEGYTGLQNITPGVVENSINTENNNIGQNLVQEQIAPVVQAGSLANAPTVASAVATTLNFTPITLSDGTKITTTNGEVYEDPSGNAYFYTGVNGADLMRYNATTGAFTYVNPVSPVVNPVSSASLGTGSGETQNESYGLPAGTTQTTTGSGEATGTTGTGQSVISMAGNTIQNVQGAIGEGINTGIGAITGVFQGDNSNKPDNLNLDPSKLKTLRKFVKIVGGAVAGMASSSQTTWDRLVDWATDPKDINRPGTVTWTDPSTKEKFSFSKFDIQNAFMLMQSSGIEP